MDAQCFGDSNVLVIVHAAICVEDLAKGLREDFQPYYSTVRARRATGEACRLGLRTLTPRGR